MDHDENTILASPVLKALNLLIDQKLASLKMWQASIKGRMERFTSPEYTPHAVVRTRTHAEGGTEHRLLFSQQDLKDFRDIIAWATADEETIRELQQFKLRLLNDYDFTHGDNSEQLAVFGEPS
jgi:hypothetical protein